MSKIALLTCPGMMRLPPALRRAKPSPSM
jgi:hypothetical protein